MSERQEEQAPGVVNHRKEELADENEATGVAQAEQNIHEE